ncbi:MAG: MarR family transcriptional regulator [Candidatus Zixiibacteriota bacterium]
MSIRSESRRRDISAIVNSVRLLQSVGRQQSQDFVRKYGITGQQLGALRIVALWPGISLGELSERLYLRISSVSGIVDRLEKRKYITRERNAVDRRVVNLNVTDAGRRVIRKTPLAGMGLLIHSINHLPTKQLQDILNGVRLLLKVIKVDGRPD